MSSVKNILPKLETKYRFITEPKLDVLNRLMAGENFRVQYRKWYSPIWRDLGHATSAEGITRLIELHKKRVTYL